MPADAGFRGRIHVAVRVGEGIDRALQAGLELAPAVAHFRFELRRRLARQDRMSQLVRADGDNRRIEAAQAYAEKRKQRLAA